MQDGVRVHRLRSRFGLLSPLLTQQTGLPGLKTRRLRDILATGFDVVNYHNISLIGGPGLLELPAGPALKLWTVHEHWFLCSTHIFWKNKEKRCDRRECLTCCLRSGIPPQLWRLSGLPRRAVAQVDAMIAPSRFTADLHRDAVAPVPVHVLPLFSRIMPDLDPRNAVADTPGNGLGGYFIFVGRMTASKGVRPMLDAFARLPQLRIKLAGGGELLDRLRVDFAAIVLVLARSIPFARRPSLDSGTGVDLQNAKLARLEMPDGSDLRGFNLKGAELSGAFLLRANLIGANLAFIFQFSINVRWSNCKRKFISSDNRSNFCNNIILLVD